MGLTKTDKQELNKAILEYLYKNNYEASYNVFIEEAGIDKNEDTSSMKNILETKWKSVAKLKRQIMSLEDQIKRYREENDVGAIMGGQKEGLPRQPEKFVLKGHKNKVTKIAFHPVVDMLASASEDSSIKLWDSESGENEWTLKGHTSKINWIDFHKKGKLLASCDKGVIKVWNVEENQCIKTIRGHEHNINSIKFLPSDEEKIVSWSWDKTIKIWNVSTGFAEKTFEGHDGWIMNLDVNANGTRMVSWSKTPEIIYWDLSKSSSKPILSIFEEEHENVIDIVVFVPLSAAKTIIKARSEEQDQGNDEQTGGNVDNEENKVEEVKTEESQTSSEPTTSKTAEALRKARERLNKLKNKDTSKKAEEEEKILEPEDDIVVKDEYVASGSRDKRIKIWNAKRGTWIMNLIGHDGWVNDIIFHPNGKYLLSGSDDKSVRIWDLEKNGVCIKKMLHIHTTFITSICLSKKSLATASVDKTIKIFKLQ